MLKTKVCADLAGPSLPPVPSNQPSPSPERLESPYLNNNSLIAQPNTETKVATEVLWTKVSNSLLLTESPLKPNIPTKPLTKNAKPPLVNTKSPLSLMSPLVMLINSPPPLTSNPSPSPLMLNNGNSTAEESSLTVLKTSTTVSSSSVTPMMPGSLKTHGLPLGVKTDTSD